LMSPDELADLPLWPLDEARSASNGEADHSAGVNRREGTGQSFACWT
jgi:hypothetical protein